MRSLEFLIQEQVPVRSHGLITVCLSIFPCLDILVRSATTIQT